VRAKRIVQSSAVLDPGEHEVGGDRRAAEDVFAERVGNQRITEP
jgi:hypothetical protein